MGAHSIPLVCAQRGRIEEMSLAQFLLYAYLQDPGFAVALFGLASFVLFYSCGLIICHFRARRYQGLLLRQILLAGVGSACGALLVFLALGSALLEGS